MAEPMERNEELIEAGPVRPLPIRAQGREIVQHVTEINRLACCLLGQRQRALEQLDSLGMSALSPA